MIDPVEDMLKKYDDADVIRYLYTKANAVRQGSRNALKTGNAAFLWATIGDQAEIMAILGAMHKRNQERLAAKSE